MKKISIALFSVFISVTLLAQDAQFGLKGGLNVSHLGSNQTEMGNRTGFHAGFLSHIHLSRNWALQPELVFSSQGTKYTSTDGEHNLILNYINIPLQAQYMFNNGFRIQTGPQVGFLTGVNDRMAGRETGFFTSDDFKSIDISWSAGLGYQTGSRLGLDARYNFGISNINDGGSAILKNNVFQVGLFYLLGN